jgi:thiamine-phosphate pyrophosphorylase
VAISGGFWTLARTAALLGRRAAWRKGLPALLFFTDPQRTPDIEAAMTALPPGSAVVFRTFGAADAEAQGKRLKSIARENGLFLLVGADAGLAARVGADGVHLPQRLAQRARRLKAIHPHWIVTAAAHSAGAARRALASGADAVVVSAIFPSNSPSAGAPMGPIRLASLVRAVGGPAYALGGVNNKTARRLKDAGLVGLAAVEALRT